MGLNSEILDRVKRIENMCQELLATEPPPPPPPPPLPDLEPIDWADVRVVSRDAQDIGNWKATSKITRVRVEAQRICIDHTKRGRWPVVVDGDDRLEGNPWIIVKIDDQLWATTYEWLRTGQECKALGNPPFDDEIGDRLAGHISQSPLRDYRPTPGERVWFCVSTMARDHRRTSDERSLVVEHIWPDGA